ncbi:hypothetical protein [Simplicispira hankyongi]|nr:hypothetical protein [Simplicispira hankyongi]
MKVYAGINVRARIDRFTQDEQNIVRNISNEFYISAGCKFLTIGQSEYRYFFLKFPDDKAIAFGAKDEIIVLFSPFDNFEPRTLDAIEKIQEANAGFRLDKICAFVISRDNGFLEKLDRTIKTQKESRLITPFTYQELAQRKDEEFFRQRIKKYSFERNLYDFDSPLRKDLYFFGRDDICQGIIDKHFAGQNSSLFGLRRSGKTSILLSICRRIANQAGYATLIDCQLLHLMSWNDALFFLSSTINDEHHCRLVIDKANYTSTNAPLAFIKDIDRIHKKLKKNILVALDEIEQITFDVSFSSNWRDGTDYVKFWHVLRSLFQRQDNPITLLIAGTNPRCLETPFILGGDNPLYGQIKAEYIPGFSVAQTKQMIETLSSYMGISIDEDIYTYLTREFGGHPFLMRQACSHIKSELDSRIKKHIDRLLFDSSIITFNDGVGHTFCEMVIGVLAEHYKDEYTMLTYLARGDILDFTELAESDQTYTQHLVGYGVLSRSQQGFDFKIDAVKKHLAKREKYKTLNLSNEEKLAEISERRNKIEQKLRKLVSQVLRTLHGEQQAKQLILAKHDTKKRTRFLALEYKHLFDANKYEIYLDDLRDLIRKDWEAGFRNIFSEDVERFNSRMILLNSIGRSDAHAKNVPDSDMQSFRGAMSWLEEKVGGYFS